jgi:hypothetical protein
MNWPNMAQKTPAVIVLILFFLSGCAHIKVPFLGKNPDRAGTVTPSDENMLVANEFVEQGRIINRVRLQQQQQQQQNLSIYPFRAGVGVEATDAMEKVAWMIVKGIADTMSIDRSGKQAPFNILTAESTDPADFVLRGHVTDLTEPFSLKQWLPLARKRSLSVAGKLMDANTGEVVIIFTEKETSNDKNDDFMKLGYDIGVNIGQFILSGVD